MMPCRMPNPEGRVCRAGRIVQSFHSIHPHYQQETLHHGIRKRTFIQGMAAGALGPGHQYWPCPGRAPRFKIGLLLPMTGPFGSTGRQIENGVRLYMAQFGDKVAGRPVQIILKDDTGVPDITKRLAQELVVNDKVDVLAGFGLTPLALATAPIASQSKTPMVIMAAATSIITEASPYIIRTSMTLPQVTLGVAEWAPKNGIKKVVSLVTDYGPGIDAEKTFRERFPAQRRADAGRTARAAAQSGLRTVPAEGA
jgi:ABC-type branched-subunit amino acid transport system substrate-binding protein